MNWGCGGGAVVGWGLDQGRLASRLATWPETGWRRGNRVPRANGTRSWYNSDTRHLQHTPTRPPYQGGPCDRRYSVPSAPTLSSRNLHDRRGNLPARIFHEADHTLERARVRTAQGRYRGGEGVVEQRHHARVEKDTRVSWGSRDASSGGPIGSHGWRRAVGHSGRTV